MWRFSCAFSKKMLKFLYYNSVEEERGVEVGNPDYVSSMKNFLKNECGINLEVDKRLGADSGAFTIKGSGRCIYMRGTGKGKTPPNPFKEDNSKEYYEKFLDLFLWWKNADSKNLDVGEWVLGIKKEKECKQYTTGKTVVSEERKVKNVDGVSKKMIKILIKEELGLDTMKEQLNKLVNAGCKQIIFTGAPGTGKTFTAKKYAKEHGKKLAGKDYGFVQFHSSYDYTDFVEGIRPVSIDKEKPAEMGFVKLDGIFKGYCREIVEEEIQEFFKDCKFDFEKIEGEDKKVVFELYKTLKKSADPKGFLTEIIRPETSPADPYKEKIKKYINDLQNPAKDNKENVSESEITKAIEELAQEIENQIIEEKEVQKFFKNYIHDFEKIEGEIKKVVYGLYKTLKMSADPNKYLLDIMSEKNSADSSCKEKIKNYINALKNPAEVNGENVSENEITKDIENLDKEIEKDNKEPATKEGDNGNNVSISVIIEAIKTLNQEIEKNKKEPVTKEGDNVSESEKNNYFFIIDEINRADLSRVFGELMYCLEEGYRGVENHIDTQYQNLKTYTVNEEGIAEPMGFDCFEDGFFIPENLVILGTMNDIDRSVETFDFALRRRFQWIPVKANIELHDGLKNMLKKVSEQGAIEDGIRMMNEFISNPGKKYKELSYLNESYHIGHAYFKDYDNVDGDKDKKLDTIFENRIRPLLREYCRGALDEARIEKFCGECKDKLLLKSKSDTKGGKGQDSAEEQNEN